MIFPDTMTPLVNLEELQRRYDNFYKSMASFQPFSDGDESIVNAKLALGDLMTLLGLINSLLSGIDIDSPIYRGHQHSTFRFS